MDAQPEFDAAGTYLGGSMSGLPHMITPSLDTSICGTASGKVSACCPKDGSISPAQKPRARMPTPMALVLDHILWRGANA